MARTEQVELTCLCMITKGDMVLLQNRVKKDWKGYTLPGGHIEPGESFVDAVIREMKEETGLEIKHPKLCGIKQFPIEGGRYLVVLFKTDEFEGELVSSEEGQMEWISRSELEQVNIVEDLPELFRVMEDDSLTEFQYVIENGEWKVVLK
ncbi:MAG: 8-oxo-dGTP diphosphatase [Lachnospiraceae bacterium]|nr:8-oxo-dGTP diphosphatase [Lachnospiraceae bacterium]